MTVTIEISKILPDGSPYDGEEAFEILGLADDRSIQTKSPLKYDFFAQIVSEKLIIQGRIQTELTVECSRCTQFFSTIVADSSFLRDYELSGGQDLVDITDDIREGILLGFPSYFVCKPDCKGLCPFCGKNLDENSCDCAAPALDMRWTELNKLDELT
jgi:uncharacterized metal-binding protein YceD (DUF177 family)